MPNKQLYAFLSTLLIIHTLEFNVNNYFRDNAVKTCKTMSRCANILEKSKQIGGFVHERIWCY
jgi:hypothetical protein